MRKYKDEKEAKEAGLTVIAYDFDGTLAEYKNWSRVCGLPIKEKLRELVENHQKGCYIIIYTTRLNLRLWGEEEVSQQEQAIDCWLSRHGYRKYVDLIVGDKPLADEYHDDRAIRFEQTDHEQR